MFSVLTHRGRLFVSGRPDITVLVHVSQYVDFFELSTVLCLAKYCPHFLPSVVCFVKWTPTLLQCAEPHKLHGNRVSLACALDAALCVLR